MTELMQTTMFVGINGVASHDQIFTPFSLLLK